MRSSLSSPASLKAGTIIAFVLVISLGGIGTIRSAANLTADDQAGSEGRVITPAGRLVNDATGHQPAVGSLPVAFVRSPDKTGPDGAGRYLIAVNSGYGVQFTSRTNKAQQSLAVIDLNAKPEPMVIQNLYFPTPQSVNLGLVFAPKPEADDSFAMYASGGFENRIWVFRFTPGSVTPITPTSTGPKTTVAAPFIDVSGFANAANTPRYNDNHSPVYPAGLDISSDGDTLYVANNLADNLGIIQNLRGARELTRVDLRRPGSGQLIYPYGVLALRSRVYVSCWGDASIAVLDAAKPGARVARISVDRHPTSMIANRAGTRIYVVNSDADSVSVIDTVSDREIERISVRLAEGAQIGSSPDSLALSPDEAMLFVANAHSNAVAVVALSNSRNAGSRSRPNAASQRRSRQRKSDEDREGNRSRVRGFIPTGQYPSAVAVVGSTVYVGNGKGTGFRNSSMVVDNSGRVPNMANDDFPVRSGRGGGGGQYSLSLIAGNISAIPSPDELQLALYTQQVMSNDGLIGQAKAKLFSGQSPIKHVIYIIKENRTYDQVFGDIARSGDGQAADGDANLAIFGAGEAARRHGGPPQDITPNHRALAVRFGLMDRFFVNAAASPEGHNWSTAAFSSDYTDKAYRWSYSSRGRSYDYEGFNRLPNWGVLRNQPPMFSAPVSADEVVGFLRRHIPYLNDARDVAEPETLYLWDAAARAGLSYRNYGEFVATVSQANIDSLNNNKPRRYPDLTQNVRVVATKKSLEGHVSAGFRNFDLNTPDSMTVDSYRATKESASKLDPVIRRDNADERFRGTSRLGEWLDEFQGCVQELKSGRPDRLPNFSMMRLSSDHTNGLTANYPTPQFYMAENDYAVGRLVEAVSNSPYWKDTAIFIVEDDAQDGPDHVDCHRSVALVISAYNRPGALIHEFHSTVSLIRTMELLLGMEPMNQLDASATPIDIFQAAPDLSPYKAVLPDVAIDNLMTPASARRDGAVGYWMRRTGEQNLSYPDLADPLIMNQAIWFSVRGEGAAMPVVARLGVVDAMREAFRELEEEGPDQLHGKDRLARN